LVGKDSHQECWPTRQNYGPNYHIKNDSTFVSQDDSPYVWISHLYSGPGIAPCDSACDVALPLNPKALDSLMMILKDVMQHNFMPSLLVLGTCAWPCTTTL